MQNLLYFISCFFVLQACKAQPATSPAVSNIKATSCGSPYISINPASCSYAHQDGRLVLYMELKLERKFDVPVTMEKVAFVLAEDKEGHNSGVFSQGHSPRLDSLTNVFVNGPAGGTLQTTWVLVQRYNNDSIEDVVAKTHKVNLKSVLFTKHDNRESIYNDTLIYDVEKFLHLLDNELAENAWLLDHANGESFVLYGIVTMEIPNLYVLVKQNRSEFSDEQYNRYLHFVQRHGEMASAANEKLQDLLKETLKH